MCSVALDDHNHYKSSEFRVRDLRRKVQELGFSIYDSGFRTPGLGFTI
jgi:hypothetical protein